jgi:hypothetical protein
VPGYVEEELRGYLECGLLCFGFGRALCTGCGASFVVAFSCKGRGVCPSCNGRHMVQTAAHLADHVIPPVPVRQWVISVPKRLRGMLADRPAAVAALTKIFGPSGVFMGRASSVRLTHRLPDRTPCPAGACAQSSLYTTSTRQDI